MTAVVALMGGLRHPAGAFLAALPLVALHDLLSEPFPHHATALMGLFFVLLAFFLPRGFLGLFPSSSPQAAPSAPLMPLWR